LQPISVHLLHALEWFFPPLPEGAQELIKAVGDSHVSLWLPLLAFAIAPAVCEELAFRGFILTGLQRSGRNWLAIVISALVFGLIHMIPQQQFNAALLGIVLGLLAVRSGSLLPPIIFHFVNNGVQVLQMRMPASALDESGMPSFFYVEDATLLARWPVLIICIAASAALITWLVRQPSAPARPREA
jgi:sodium transport system permease protein